MSPSEANISSTAGASATELVRVCCHANRCPGPRAGIFQSNDNKEEEDDKLRENVIYGTISIHIQWRVWFIFSSWVNSWSVTVQLLLYTSYAQMAHPQLKGNESLN